MYMYCMFHNEVLWQPLAKSCEHGEHNTLTHTELVVVSYMFSTSQFMTAGYDKEMTKKNPNHHWWYGMVVWEELI